MAVISPSNSRISSRNSIKTNKIYTYSTLKIYLQSEKTKRQCIDITAHALDPHMNFNLHVLVIEANSEVCYRQTYSALSLDWLQQQDPSDLLFCMHNSIQSVYSMITPVYIQCLHNSYTTVVHRELTIYICTCMIVHRCTQRANT